MDFANWTLVWALVPVAYLIGAFPTGLILGYVFKGLDIRKHGSGGSGATNVGRVLGREWFLLISAIDFLKSLFVILATIGISDNVYVLSSVALALVLGNSYPIWSSFKGGKGAATLAGLAMAFYIDLWFVTLTLFVALSIAIYITRTVSLITLFGIVVTATFAVYVSVSGAAPWSHLIAIGVAIVPTLLRHLGNVRRLALGRENTADFLDKSNLSHLQRRKRWTR